MEVVVEYCTEPRLPACVADARAMRGCVDELLFPSARSDEWSSGKAAIYSCRSRGYRETESLGKWQRREIRGRWVGEVQPRHRLENMRASSLGGGRFLLAVLGVILDETAILAWSFEDWCIKGDSLSLPPPLHFSLSLSHLSSVYPCTTASFHLSFRISLLSKYIFFKIIYFCFTPSSLY